MNEVEVHNSLLCFLRSHSEPHWPHHLTMGRLVARALRLDRSALIQTGFSPSDRYQRYRVSYLMPLLMWPQSAVLVASASLQQHLLRVEIPRLQQWLQTHKPIHTYPCSPDFDGLLLIEPKSWLGDRLRAQERLPNGIPTVIDGADDLEGWTRDRLTVCVQPGDWNQLMQQYPDRSELIRDTRVQLTRSLFQHPANPYECCLLEVVEQDILHRLYQEIWGALELLSGGAEGQGSGGDGEMGRWGAEGQGSGGAGEMEDGNLSFAPPSPPPSAP
ncbi:ATP-dependent DNA helicase, partial [Kamptonema sp. UHCC 0994]|nr:ATP-dependent DNA helicase [Kamptonema sp. UHCC 0994]